MPNKTVAQSAQEIRTAADTLFRKYTDTEQIEICLLSDTGRTVTYLDLLGIMYRNVLTSLQFSRFHRAVNYLRAMDKLGAEFLTEDEIKRKQDLLTKKMTGNTGA